MQFTSSNLKHEFWSLYLEIRNLKCPKPKPEKKKIRILKSHIGSHTEYKHTERYVYMLSKEKREKGRCLFDGKRNASGGNGGDE